MNEARIACTQCRPGDYLCTEAERLWVETGRQHQRIVDVPYGTPLWEPRHNDYLAALGAYWFHVYGNSVMR